MTKVSQISESDYFNLKMANMPKVEKGAKRVIKKGDNLWKIAKENLGKNAKKSEVLDYTYRVAKLNNFKSIEQANNIKANDEIYLPKLPETSNTKKAAKAKPQAPKVEKKSQQTKQQSVRLEQEKTDNPFLKYTSQDRFESKFKPNQEEIKVPFATKEQLKAQSTKKKPVVAPIKPAQKAEPKKVQAKPKNNAELGFEAVKEEILNAPSKDTFVSCGYRSGDLRNYTLYYKHPRGYEPNKSITNFVTDKNGNLLEIAFNGKKDEVDIFYDFEINRNGQIMKRDELNQYTIPAGNIDKKTIDKIEKVLKQKVAEAENNN